MRLEAALALGIVTVALAGCVSPATPEDPAALPAAPALVAPTAGLLHLAGQALAPAEAAMAQAVGAQFPTGVAAAEPTIGITSDGAVFMTGNVPNPTCGVAGGCPVVPYANFNNGPTIMRSTDQGQTWTDVFPKLPTGDSYKLRTWDPMVLVDRDTDRVFMDDIYPLGCGFLSFSDDRGESWTHNPASCGNPNGNDHQTIGTAKPRVLPTVGYPNLVYRCVNNLAYTGCAISVNGGLTFSPQLPVQPTLENCLAITGHLEADSEGRMFLPTACNGNPAIVVTEDDGQTWTASIISADHDLHGLHVDIAIDEADNLYAIWETDDLPWFATSTDHGATWSPAATVAAPGVTMTKFNAVAAGAPGKVAFAYVGTTIADAPNLPAAECGVLPALPCTDPEAWAEATWNAYVAVSEDALAAAPVFQTVTANDPADPLSRGACADRCHGMTDFIDIQVDAAGRPWASFVDVCVAECVTDPAVLFDGNIGFAATLLRGPALRGDAAVLPEIAAPPAAGGA